VSSLYGICAVVAIVLFIYLLFALFNAEDL
jgi:K+-transporting ATPase KdpF subunit